MIEDVVGHAERALTEAWSGRVSLRIADRISADHRRNLVVRCAVTGAPAGAPDTVIVKQAAQTDYQPEQPGGTASDLFNEWCGAKLLGGLGMSPSVAPRFYAGSRAHGMVVIEDLGHATSLADVLLKGESDEAEAALLSLGAGLGRMAGATMGEADRYVALRRELGPIDAHPAESQGSELRASIPGIIAALARLAIAPPPGFASEIEGVAQRIADPGPFLAYSHGDPCPDNCLCIDGRILLIDFEFGGFRHALLDGVYGRMSFPTCWCVHRIPARAIAAMEQAYRRELAACCAAAGDEAEFGSAVGDACGFWALGALAHVVPAGLDGGRCWGISTYRQRAPARLEAFVHLGDERYPALRAAMQSVLAALEALWAPDERTLPLFPAFLGAGRGGPPLEPMMR